MNILIKQVHESSYEIIEQLQSLISQLSSVKRLITQDSLSEIVHSTHTFLFLAYNLTEKQQIIGTLTLVVYQCPTTVRARIEDLVVDTIYRQKGIGRKLLQTAIEKAKEIGADTIDLTSNPSRIAATQLYKTIGFTIRDTYSYRYKIVKK